MNLLKKISLFSLLLFITAGIAAQQPTFSIATDIGLQRSFKKGQRYWAGGHTVHVNVHFNQKGALYAWISYYNNGEFTNRVTATAKSPFTTPQSLDYNNQALMRFKHLSVGWKKYLKGTHNQEENWALYGYAGFGLMLGRIENRHSNFIDTVDYNVPVRSGKANFKRLTLDLGLGWEADIGGNIYLYAEGRAWIPTSDFPSKYLFVNDNAPLVGMFNVGLRILFED